MVTIRPSGGACGAIVTDVDLDRDLSDDLMRDLTAALYRHRVLVIKNQDLTKEAYYRFGQEWGELIRHVLDYLRMPGYPEMMAIGNTEEKDKDDAVRNGAAAWHTDGSYIVDPTMITMLYARAVPKNGGETMIADMVAAYEALSPEDKAEADQLSAMHYYGRGTFDADEHASVPIKTEEQANRYPPCEKPLVLTHPVAGHRALYAVAQTPFEVLGKPEAEGARILAKLKAHATQPRFVYAHRYEVGDIVLFDTLSTLHRAKDKLDHAPSENADNARLLWRLSTKGTPRVLLRPAA